MTDETLIAGFLGGDEVADRRIRGWVRAAAHGYRGRLGDAIDDLEQEILLDLTTTLRGAEFAGRSQLETYVRRAAHYKCIDRLRADRRRTFVDVDDLELTSEAPSALDRLSRSEATRLGLEVVGAMSESCRELWAMIDEGLSYREMSERTGLRSGALRARVHRCRQRALELRDRKLEELAAVVGDGSDSATTENRRRSPLAPGEPA